MKLRSKMVVRALVALLLLVLAGGIAIIIKDTLAERNPESALPVMRVDYNGVELPAVNVMMDSYAWRFLNDTEKWEQPDRSKWITMEAAYVSPASDLDISFSFEPSSVKISRAFEGSFQFEEVVGDLQTPTLPGVYTYKVEGNWGLRGSVLFYFKLRV